MTTPLSPKALVLKAFLNADGAFVSGSALGKVLGVSRVSIWNHLEALRHEGFAFEAIRNRGYRMISGPDTFHHDWFSALLDERPCPFFQHFRLLDETASTNSVAEGEFAANAPDPFFVIANLQTAGRGRRGRTWHSPAHKNLALSIGLRPSLPPARLQTITLWTGLQLARFFRERFDLPVMVKWPNDLYLNGRKLAGILTEARVDSEQTRDLVIGIGININAANEDFPQEIHGIATSLAIALQRTLSISRLACELVHVLADGIETFLSNDYADQLMLDWPDVDYLRERRIDHEHAHGRVMGIHPSGALRIQRDDGSIAVLHSGEIQLA